MMKWCQKHRQALRGLYLAGWGALVVFYLLLPLPYLDGDRWDYDEGPTLQAAALANRGYRLYSETVLNKPPLLAWILQGAFRLWGESVSSGRLGVLLVTTIGFVAIGWLADLWFGRPAGLVAMVCFLALPGVPVRAAVAMPNLPAASAVVLSLIGATCYQRTHRWSWLLMSALAFSAVLLFHPILLPVFLAVGIVIVNTPQDGSLTLRNRGVALLVFGVCIAVPIVVWFLLSGDQRAVIRWLVEYNFAPIAGQGRQDVLPRLEQIASDRLARATLALIGVSLPLLLRLRVSRRWLMVVLMWLLGVISANVSARLGRYHYRIFLVYPAVVAAGGGVAILIKMLLPYGISSYVWRIMLCEGFVLAVVLFAVSYVGGHVTWPTEWSGGRQEARDFLREHCSDGRFVASDDQFLAFSAGCLVPPSLADTSFTRIRTGFLQADEVITVITQQQVKLVVYASGRFELLPELSAWLEQRGASVREFDTVRVYQLN